MPAGLAPAAAWLRQMQLATDVLIEMAALDPECDRTGENERAAIPGNPLARSMRPKWTARAASNKEIASMAGSVFSTQPRRPVVGTASNPDQRVFGPGPAFRADAGAGVRRLEGYDLHIELPQRRIHSLTRFKSCALIATTTVLADMSTAPTAGVSRMPHGASTPAASGIAKML